MAIQSEDLSARALAFLENLVDEVGPRPAGSPAEKAAQEHIAARLGGRGLRLEWSPVPFRPKEFFFPDNGLIGLALFAAANDLAEGAGWLALAMPLFLIGLPEVLWLLRRASPATGGPTSQNLLVLPEKAELADLDLLLVAHVDTARAKPASGEAWYQWRTQVFRTTLRVALILAILVLMELIGFTLPPAIPLAGQIVTRLLLAVLVVQDLWEHFGARGKFVPGANDNGSGAAVLTTLAEHLAENPPAKASIGYLFTAAEECGLYGARAFAETLPEKEAGPLVLSVDMVGAGDGLKVITGGGQLLRYQSDRELVELLERADPAIERLHYDRRAGDFEPFIRAGWKAAGVEANGTKRSWRAYHAVTDDMGIVDPGMLTHTIDVLRQLVWLIDKGKKS